MDLALGGVEFLDVDGSDPRSIAAALPSRTTAAQARWIYAAGPRAGAAAAAAAASAGDAPFHGRGLVLGGVAAPEAATDRRALLAAAAERRAAAAAAAGPAEPAAPPPPPLHPAPQRLPQPPPPPPDDSPQALTADLVRLFLSGLAREAGAGGPTTPAARAVRGETVAAMLARAAASAGQGRGGKWVLFASRAHVDAAWAKLAALTAAGAVGPAAKVSTADPPGARGGGPPRHVLIAYTESFADAADVRRVLDVLVAAGVAPRPGAGPVVGYKPDAWTLLEAGLLTLAAVPGDGGAAAQAAAGAAAAAAAAAALQAWHAPRYRHFRTLYQSDVPGGWPPAPPKRPLPRVEGGAAAAAAAVELVLRRRPAGGGGAGPEAARGHRGWEGGGSRGGGGRGGGGVDDDAAVIVVDDDSDDDGGGGRGAPRPRVG